MRISFTGPKTGMNDRQKKLLAEAVRIRKPSSFSHGCCIGADIEAHIVVRKELGRFVYISVFPSTSKTRAPIPVDSDYVAEFKPPLERNPDIVEAGRDLLIATPKQMYMIQRSGTWSTIRYAKSRRIRVLILWPEEKN